MSTDMFDPDIIDKLSDYVQILQADRASLANQMLCLTRELNEAIGCSADPDRRPGTHPGQQRQ